VKADVIELITTPEPLYLRLSQ